MLKKITALILIAAACTLPISDLSARGGHGGGHGGGRGFHGHGGFRGGGWGSRGYWGGRRWGGWGLGLGWGLGWGWPYAGGYPWWRSRYYGYPWWYGSYGYPYGYPAYPYPQYPAYTQYGAQQPIIAPAQQPIPTQTAPTQAEPDYVRDSAGQTSWAMTNQAPFPIKVATDREVIELKPGEQKMVSRGYDFTFTAEGGGVSRQFSSRDHTVNLDANSFGLQQQNQMPKASEKVHPAHNIAPLGIPEKGG